MKKFENRKLTLMGTECLLEDGILELLGEEGYRLVGVRPDSEYCVHLYFSRSRRPEKMYHYQKQENAETLYEAKVWQRKGYRFGGITAAGEYLMVQDVE